MRLNSNAYLTIISSFDFNEKNSGTSFKAHHDNRLWDPMMWDFSKWSTELFGKWTFCVKKNALMNRHFREGQADQQQ